MSEKNEALVEVTQMTAGSGSLAEYSKQRDYLATIVRDKMVRDIDFGIIPGVQKESLYKAGAEKIAQFFGLGARISAKDKTIDLDANFAMFSYTIEIFHLKSGISLAQCEGSANSQEKKYRARKENGALTPTPIGDIMNTLQKMAQKRAYVGAVIQAIGASDFYTQDIDTPEDAQALGIKERSQVQVTIPKVTKATSHSVGEVPKCCGKAMKVSQFFDNKLGENPWYCQDCKSKLPRL